MGIIIKIIATYSDDTCESRTPKTLKV